jgi:hypothetical protein
MGANADPSRLRSALASSRHHADAQGGGLVDGVTWALFVSGTVVSRVGARWGIGWLTYNPLLFGWFHLVAARIAPGLYTALRCVFPQARRIADVGAGSGAMAAHGRRLGLDVVACEHSRVGRVFARLQGVRSRPFDVTTSRPAILGRPADVAYSIEVAEHVPAQLADRLVGFLAATAPVVVFTAAPPGQGGQGHVNEQPRTYWIERFARHGCAYDASATERLQAALRQHLRSGAWVARNAMVFRRD